MQIEEIAKITAPLLLSYTKWVLARAEQTEIKTLYFVSRDGYIPYRFALEICSDKVKCKYLYCSRYSLRIPALHLMGEERNRLIFSGSNRITAKIFLSRAGLDLSKRQKIYKDVNYKQNENEPLSRKQASVFRKKLEKSKLFKQYIDDESKKAYENTIGYLKQEGLAQNSRFGIVDLGWTGTSAALISRLLFSCGVKPQITGFYFGLYSRQICEGLTCEEFYFSPSSNLFKLAKFNNNLLEAVCIAPHGRTVSYSFDGEKYLPIFAIYNPSKFERNLLFEQLKLQSSNKCMEISDKAAQKSLVRLMLNPTLEEARLLSQLCFCDDVCESYPCPITAGEPKSCTVFSKLKEVLTGKKGLLHRLAELPFWEYGCVALKNPHFKAYYRFNIFLWEALRICRYRLSWEYIMQSLKNRFTGR